MFKLVLWPHVPNILYTVGQGGAKFLENVTKWNDLSTFVVLLVFPVRNLWIKLDKVEALPLSTHSSSAPYNWYYLNFHSILSNFASLQRKTSSSTLCAPTQRLYSAILASWKLLLSNFSSYTDDFGTSERKGKAPDLVSNVRIQCPHSTSVSSTISESTMHVLYTNVPTNGCTSSG